MTSSDLRYDSFMSADDEPQGVSGKTVLVLLMTVSVVTVVVGLTFIHPEPGTEPAPVNRRPFGPATRDDYRDRPLIERAGTTQPPTTMPANGG